MTDILIPVIPTPTLLATLLEPFFALTSTWGDMIALLSSCQFGGLFLHCCGGYRHMTTFLLFVLVQT